MESPELDLVAPGANAEGDAMNTTMSVSTLTATELVEESSLVSTSAIPAIEDLSSSICKSYD